MAHATTAATGTQTETQRLYDSLWTQNSSVSAQRTMAIAASLDLLAQLLERKINPDVAKGYKATLADLTRAEIVLAFSRAHDELKFFPAPATLREFSGRPVSGDPIAAEAREQLQYLLNGMRSKHGPKLQDTPAGYFTAPRSAHAMRPAE